jgi:triacylglycerol lipase
VARGIVTSATLVVGLVGCGSVEAVPGYELLSGSGGAQAASSASASSGAGAAPSTSSGSGGDTERGAPYPIVLAHGFFGFEEFAGIDFITYYYGVREHLAEHGEPLVFTPAVDPFNSSTYRGAQLYQAIQQILAETGHAKVNLIGHSQGGLDARVVAHDHPEIVASVVTLQTPHQGTPLADIALELASSPYLQDIVDAIVGLAAAPLWDEAGNETSLFLPLELFSEEGIASFNAAYPNAPGVVYASIAGRSDMHDGGNACAVSGAPPFVAAFNDEQDPLDPFFAVTDLALDGGPSEPYANDGLIRVTAARWGEFLGCLPADHLDMIGQLFGDAAGSGNDWNYLAFYVELVSWLRARGL